MKVLVAIDDSVYSQAALDHIKTRNWPADSEFCLATVVHDFSAYLKAAPEHSLRALEDDAADLEFGALQFIEEKRKDLKSAFPLNSVYTAAERGIVSEGIVSIANTWGADCIIVGSHGFKGVEQSFLGSVADEVVEQAPCTVEIIRSPQLIASRHDTSIDVNCIDLRPWLKVLVGCDFSNNATEAFEWIATQYWQKRTQFVLVDVLLPYESTPATLRFWTRKNRAKERDELRAVKRKMNDLSAELKKHLNGTDAKVSFKVLVGVPEEVLYEFSKEIEADLIVVGADKVPFELGGKSIRVAKSIVKSADCSVAVVRTPFTKYDTAAFR
ncbi:MAG: universal stress protein [Cyanobacteria bacterium]|nr:universal stress protein [Cyanobacteriota bacterium]